MLKIRPGAIIIGKSGKKLLVERVDGEIIFCKGDLKVRIEAVVQVIPPTTFFRVGDRVQYIGSDFYLKRIYAGILEVWEISLLDGYACLKPDGRLTSWILFQDLKVVVDMSN